MATDPAVLAALRLLARRELSSAQVRSRLARLGHEPSTIERAIEELQSDRRLDDERVARALARTESAVRKRGPQRVRQRLAAAGIEGAVAERAIDEAFQQVDEGDLLRAVLDARLSGRESIADRREFARLYRHLTGRGFAPDRVLATLRSIRITRDSDE